MSPTLEVGTDFAGYHIESALDRGGMSEVFLAEHLRLGRKAALKVLATDLGSDQTFRDRFIAESRLAASLNHPNIIPIYDAGEADGILYIAMRLVEGADLKTVIREDGPLEVPRTLSIIRQAASALDSAHAAGLVHRDVKPGNILIAPATKSMAEHVYLTDFGLTKRTDSRTGYTKTGQFVGSVDYVAPERIDGSKSADARVDVYSLGCVLFECLTGRVPFERDSDMAALWAHVNEPPPAVTPIRPNLPASFDFVVSRAMAKQASQRYATCGELSAAAEVAAASGARPVLGEPPDVATGTARPAPGSGEATAPSVPGSPPAPPVALSSAPEGSTPPSIPALPPSPPGGVPPRPRARRTSGGPSRPGTRSVLVTVIALLAVGAFFLGAFVFPDRSNDPTQAAGGGSPRATGGPSPGAAVSGCTDLNGAPVSVGTTRLPSDTVTCLLAKHVAASIRAGCRVLDGTTDADQLPRAGGAQQPPAADVFLRCEHVSFGGNTFTVWYMFKHDRDEVGNDYKQILNSNGIGINQSATQESCATTHPIERIWYVENQALDPAGAATNIVHTFDRGKAVEFSRFYPRSGRFVCFQDGADEWIAWTDANLTVLSVARNSGGNWDKLLRWWALDAGPGHPPVA